MADTQQESPLDRRLGIAAPARGYVDAVAGCLIALAGFTAFLREGVLS